MLNPIFEKTILNSPHERQHRHWELGACGHGLQRGRPFVRHAYFLSANETYSALKITLKVEINAAALATLNSDTPPSFPKLQSSLIAVKVINAGLNS